MSWRSFVIVSAMAAVLAFDLSRPAGEQRTAAAAVAGVHLYQHTFARLMPALGIRCRFEPTCSVYAETVLARDGVLRGGWLSLQRLSKCGPWTPMGTKDPP